MRESSTLLRLISKHRDRVSVALFINNVLLLYLIALQLNYVPAAHEHTISSALAIFISVGFLVCAGKVKSRNANVEGSSQLGKGEGSRRIENAQDLVSIGRVTNPHHVMVRGFKDLPTTKDRYVESPLFMCNGHQWALRVYPGGHRLAAEGYVSIGLTHRSEGSITVNYELSIIDKFGKQKIAIGKSSRFECSGFQGDGRCLTNLIKRSDILDESQNILDSDGMLTVAVSIKPSDLFVPKNPLNKLIQGMFLGGETSDVCFEVHSVEDEEKEEVPASESFHAHSQILKACAPILFDLFDLDDSDGKIATVIITGVKPDIFRHLLRYVYGGSVPEEELKTHAKDIIEAADKYAIVNLKLEAEAAYVESTTITTDNAIDNILYADAKNCALIEEAVFDFLMQNGEGVITKLSFDDVPGHLAKDILTSFKRKEEIKKKAADDFDIMRVSELRRMLDEKGLAVDGTRKVMIEALKSNS